MEYLWLKKTIGGYFNEMSVNARNIIFEKQAPFLAKIKNNILGRLIGQKIIAVCQGKA